MITMKITEKTRLNTAHILVVDDETTARGAIARALQLSGYQVQEADSGEEALQYLNAQPYDVMLLDLRMPGIDGVTVMRHIRAEHPHTTVIVLTGYATLESAIEAVKVGAADYLMKPCSIREIITAVENAHQRRQEPRLRQQLIEVMQEALGALQTPAPPPVVTTTPPSHTPSPLQLDSARQQLLWNPMNNTAPLSVELTTHETTLLTYQMEHPNAILTCNELATVLGYEQIAAWEAQEIVRPHISRLRQKIRRLTPEEIIFTIRGKGYRFNLP